MKTINGQGAKIAAACALGAVALATLASPAKADYYWHNGHRVWRNTVVVYPHRAWVAEPTVVVTHPWYHRWHHRVWYHRWHHEGYYR